MENEEEIKAETYPEIKLNEEMRSHLYEMAKWANFLGIVGFVLTGIMVLAGLSIGAAIKTNPAVASMFGQMGAAGASTLSIVFMLYALAIFYPSLLMFRYAANAKQGVLYGEQENLSSALGKLKSLFKYWGILAILLIALYGFAIVAQMLQG